MKSYLFTILRNLFLTRRRQAARHVPLEDTLADPGRGQDDRASAASELAHVREHLSTMAVGDREALLMRTAGGFSYEDIGKALGLSAGAARVRVHRARAQLAKAVGKTLRSPS